MISNKAFIIDIIITCILLVTLTMQSNAHKHKLDIHQQELIQQQQTIKKIESNIEKYKQDNAELRKELQQEQEKTNKLKEETAGLNKKLSYLLSRIEEKRKNNRFKDIRVNKEERELLEHLVEAEAGIEPMQGKIAVVNCVLNRVMSHYYPNSVKSVILQPLQYETVFNGMIQREPSKDSREAVKRALAGENYIGDCFSFWADYLPANNSLWQLPIIHRIGSHVFTNKY